MSRVLPLIDVSVTRKRPGGDEFIVDPQLLCSQVVVRSGTAMGHASFMVVGLDNEPLPAEDVLRSYAPNDEVRVTLGPAPDGRDDEDADDRVLFAGLLSRATFDTSRHADTERETQGLVALPWPAIDNRASEHLVRGRWLIDPQSTSSTQVIESPAIPPVFNAGGRPNRNASQKFTSQGPALSAYAFTYDGDPDAKYWTVGDAVASLLAKWLFGDVVELERHTSVQNYTKITLEAGSTEAPTLQGIEQVCPPVDVSGLGVFDAIDRVCAAAGFEWACDPVSPSDEQILSESSHLYAFRMWRAGYGDTKAWSLSKRGAFTGNANTDLERNNISRINGQVDAARVVNEVFGIGRAYIEATVELKPLWREADFTAVAPADRVRFMGRPANQDTEDYYRRHVAGGDDFSDYGHVGRLWGLDCTGHFEGDYTGAYQQDAEGVDWVALLGIDANAAFVQERTNNGITEDIVWTKRPRVALPLTMPAAQRAGRDFILEASDDGGSTWVDVTEPLAPRLHREYFGILITGVPNMLGVNFKTLKGAVNTDPATSLWALIESKQLRFRLTCRIECDHATRYDALKDDRSGISRAQGRQIIVDAGEVWVAPNSFYNDTSGWVRSPGFGVKDNAAGEGEEGEYIRAVRGVALRERDATDRLRRSTHGSTWLMRTSTYRLGDRIQGVTGRQMSFATQGAGGTRYPSIVAITINLHPSNQSVDYALGDESRTKGVR